MGELQDDWWWYSDASLANDFTGTDYADWTAYIATATKFQSTPTMLSPATSASSTASAMVLTTTDSKGNLVTSTVSLSTLTGTAGSHSLDETTLTSSSGGMSNWLKATVGVSVVVGVLMIAALIFLVMRCRKRTDGAETIKEKPRKTWTSHFRNFTFDNELLPSERGSFRTARSTGSVIGTIRSVNASVAQTTVYHNVASHAGQPASEILHTNQVPPVLDMSDVDGDSTLGRSLSLRTDATPPPPYQAATNVAGNEDSPISPVSTHRNPFLDSRSNSPTNERTSTNENPFSDHFRSHS